MVGGTGLYIKAVIDELNFPDTDPMVRRTINKEAEELGINQGNVDQLKTSENPNIKRFLGTEGDLGKGAGLSNDFAANAVKAVGNYGEVYERNLGQGSQFKLPRGQNALWTNGGLMYSPPLR
jgi:general L-amino acid transport system substrate-binding protein